GRQGADQVSQLRAIERGDLMAERDAAAKESRGASGYGRRRRSAPGLGRGGRERHHDDRSPALGLVEGIMGENDHMSTSPLLRTRARGELRPPDLAALQ